MINEKIFGTIIIFFPIIMTAAKRYTPTITGTNFDATIAILFIPPKITAPTKQATKQPVNKSPIKILS